jgi:two-component system, chemotaxis family, CheB/CheR fusion protein
MKTFRTPRDPPGTRSSEAGRAPLTVIGIGASAGGLKALQEFVEAVPKDSGMAFVVILHLDPARESRMAELLQNRAAIPVTQVSGPTTVEGDHMYIIPPGKDLAMRGETIFLRDRGERADHAPVDLFFRTLAEAYGAEAVGVVLSGTGEDGTAGIRYIRDAGGITVAQSPAEAEFDSMPVSAIATDLIDLVLPAKRMPGELIRLSRRPHGGGDEASPTPETEAGLARVFAVLRSQTGHDFSLYKRSMVLRRLDRRLGFNDVATLEEYVSVLESNAPEGQALLRDLLISVSSFFRDPEAFGALAALMPSLFERRGLSDTVRVWVVGCATGEEVYSVAMVLAEQAAKLVDPPAFQLFATDIDEKGYGWARAGLYTAAAVANIEPERLRKFFTKEAGGYRIAKSLRERVLFAGHNVLHDPPFSRIDLISCRNLFIYLRSEAQERALETFHFALRPEGMLFLGTSESVGDGGLFVPANGDGHRIYLRSTAPHRAGPRPSSADPEPGSDGRGSSGAPGSPGGPSTGGAASYRAKERFSYGALHLRMLEEYAPASVIVDERLNVVHLSANAGRFLHLGEGEPSHSLLGLAREELRRVLRTALHQVFRDRASITRRIRMEVDGERRPVTVHVRPSPEEGRTAGRFALVVFDVQRDGGGSGADPGDEADLQPASIENDLAEELRNTRDLLESVNLEHDRTVAELQTVNEELQSVNEEQRAATEELETGREEIQSINEELTAINQEHQGTIEELKRTNADLQNLIESTGIGTIFLDRSMRIRRFTPTAGALFNFVPADQGRSLSDITHRLAYDRLDDDVATVLESLDPVEREVESETGEAYILRINPYRSMDGDHDGVVLTFVDNTSQREAREQLREAMSHAEAANLAKGTFMATLSHEFRTPLNAILGYADLLQFVGPLSEEQELKVSRIKAAGWHLAAMIGEILSFAKLDGGHDVVQTETLDARLIARDAGNLVEPAANAKQLAMVVDLPEEPLELTTDVDKARQVLVNLCGNATKYTERGEVRLRVRGEEGRVTFMVSDTGMGIAPEHHARIFERFWQVDGASTRAAGGLGIGLAAAREYARLLGGDVTVESGLGSGSTFRFWLPA